MEHDPLTGWRTALTPIIHPTLRFVPTLFEMEGRLAGVVDYLDGIDHGQATQGFAVAELAIRYAEQLLDHFRVLDSHVAPPGSLDEARVAVRNLLALVRLPFTRKSIRTDDAPRSESLAVSSDASAPAATPVPSGLPPAPNALRTRTSGTAPAVETDQFLLHWQDKTYHFTNKKPFWVLAYLVERFEKWVSVQDLADNVWHDSQTEQGTVQRTVSQLRNALRTAEITGLKIDGTTNKGYYRLEKAE